MTEAFYWRMILNAANDVAKLMALTKSVTIIQKGESVRNAGTSTHQAQGETAHYSRYYSLTQASERGILIHSDFGVSACKWSTDATKILT